MEGRGVLSAWGLGATMCCLEIINRSMWWTGFSYQTGSWGRKQTDWVSPLKFINSEDIDQIDVLKGPTAAALYGARGANGVVLITTKKGSKKSGFGIEYVFSTRFTEPYLFQKFQDQYGSGG